MTHVTYTSNTEKKQKQKLTHTDAKALNKSSNQLSFLESFSRAQISSALATAADYGTLFFLAEICHVWYVIATASGAFVGAVINFWVNRHWSFRASEGLWKTQVLRYTLVSTGSLLLNTGGVFLVTEYARVHYAISVVVVSIVVGFLFNYPLHRHYVYRE